MESFRTHDKFYLKENYKTEPKEYYKMVQREMEKDFREAGRQTSVSILDIGCETGSFLHYLRRCYPYAELAGMDVMQELLDQVSQPEDAGIRTVRADISDASALPDKKYQAVSCLGVFGIIDDYACVLENIMTLVEEGGTAYIFGAFNPEGLDVVIRCRRSRQTGEWEKGWNLFSLESLSALCEDNGWVYQFLPFEMPFPIPKHEDDPLRSWTVENGNSYMVINGLQLIHHFYLLKIKK